MSTFLSMLRGINVGGRNQIKMADLKVLYEELDLTNVTTYIQSGNVIFNSKAEKQLALKIKNKIYERYKFEVPVIIRTPEQLKKVIDGNPFTKETKISADNQYIVFLDKEPDMERINKLKSESYEPEKYLILGKEIYLYCHNGYGKTKLTNNYFENKFSVAATTRNWRTVNELYKIINGNN
jgi:uncharacterized protein (DUF1697 family)